MNSNASEQADRDTTTTIAFGPYLYDAVRRELFDEGRSVRLGSRALQLLEVLLERPGRLYSREELVSRVWPRTVVEETSLRVHISALRRVLGDGQNGAKYIANVPGRGYAFVGEVRKALMVSPPLPSPTSVPPLATDLPETGVRLPTRLTRPIGRGQIISQIGELISQERLVSVVGAGGMGKTTVALAVAENHAALYEQGSFFVDFSRLTDPALVVVEVGQSHGLNVARTEPWATLEDALRDKHVLIILDNCEHVIDAVAALVDRLLRVCPRVHFLATSREPLEVEAEWIFRLPPLGVPEPERLLELESVLAYPAIQLFVERARAACDSFQLSEANASAVRELCQFLDGIPLAIELAAARVGSLGVHGLLPRLESAFEILTRGRRTALSRHRTLHAVLNWSYELLSDTEKLVLQRLSVFRGTFDLDGAVAVVASADLPKQRVVEDVLSLCTKSLVMLEHTESHLRHRLLYVTRLFAEKAHADAPDASEVHRRHAEFVLGVSVRAGKAHTDMAHYRWTSELVTAMADLRAAIAWTLIEENDLILGMEITAESLRSYLDASLIDEYRRYVLTALDKASRAGIEGTRLEFKLQVAHSFLFAQASTGPEGQGRIFAKTRDLASRFGSVTDKIEALYGMAAGAYGQGNYIETLTCSEEIRELAQGELEPLSVAIADRMSALSLHALGQHDAAERLALRVMRFKVTSLERRFQSEVPFGVSMRIQLARICWLRGEFQKAWTVAQEAIVREATAHMFAKCQPLGMAAIPIAIWKGDFATAARWNQELLDHTVRGSFPYWQAFANVYRSVIEGHPILPGSAEGQLLERSPLLMDIVCTLQTVLPSPIMLTRVTEGQVGWSAPEVLRLAALADLDPHNQESRTRCIAALQNAMALSSEQGALFWSLRIAISICQIAPTSGLEHSSAKDQLLALLNIIDDGSPLPDLQRARKLAQSLL